MTSNVNIPTKPYLKPWYRLLFEDDIAVLQYGSHAVRFQGAGIKVIFPVLLPMLDGTKTREELVDLLGLQSAAALDKALQLLAQNGLLTEGPLPKEHPDLLAETLLFASANAFIPPTSVFTSEELATLEIALIGTGLTADLTRRELQLAGIRCNAATLAEVAGVRAANPRTLVVVAPNHDEMDQMDEINERLLEDGVTWLYVSPYNGHFLSVGPIFVPRETGCFHCFMLRQSSNRPLGGQFMKLAGTKANFPQPHFVSQLAASMAANLVVQWSLMRNVKLAGQFYHVEFNGGLRIGSSMFHKVPRCPVCSRAAAFATPCPWAES